MKFLIKNTLLLLFTGFGFALGADRDPEKLILPQNQPTSPWLAAVRPTHVPAPNQWMNDRDLDSSITNSNPGLLSDVLQRAPALQVTERHFKTAEEIAEKNNKKRCKPLVPCLFAGLVYFKESGSSFLGWCADMGSATFMVKSGWQLWKNHQMAQQSQAVFDMLSIQNANNQLVSMPAGRAVQQRSSAAAAVQPPKESKKVKKKKSFTSLFTGKSPKGNEQERKDK